MKKTFFILLRLKNCQKNDYGKPYKFKQSTVKKKKGFSIGFPTVDQIENCHVDRLM